MPRHLPFLSPVSKSQILPEGGNTGELNLTLKSIGLAKYFILQSVYLFVSDFCSLSICHRS